MQRVRLVAQCRTPKGSCEAGRVRRSGFIPAVLYGHGMKAVSLQVSGKDLLHILHTRAGENALIDLDVQGIQLQESTCLIRDLQHNPVTDEITHIDFSVVSLTEKITVNVPLVVPNQEDIEGVKQGGILDIVHHEIEVECLPTAIPEKIEINLKNMKIGDAIHAREITLPMDVTCLFDPEEVIVAVHAPKKEEVKAEEGAQQPEVIEKGKKEEAEEAGEGEAKKPKEGEVKKPEAKKPEAKKPEK